MQMIGQPKGRSLLVMTDFFKKKILLAIISPVSLYHNKFVSVVRLIATVQINRIYPIELIYLIQPPEAFEAIRL